jgi:murein DD-endopeptidase MepM/ murein hydrolase activator NlpD
MLRRRTRRPAPGLIAPPALVRHPSPTATTAPRAALLVASLVALLVPLLTACEVLPKDSAKKQDTTTVPPTALPAAGGATTAAAGSAAGGSGGGGVPAVPTDSAVAAAAAPDTGVVRLYPEQPRRGGVLFALAEGLAAPTPRCSWDGAPLPCYRVRGGVLATVSLSADDSAGVHELAFERPSGRLTRQVTVADEEFGRTLVFLDSARYALLRRGSDLARDARALRAVLTTETPERLWRGRWREPVPFRGATGYGVQRFYYLATDSARAITLSPSAPTRAPFAADTSDAPASAGDAPGWRHSGVDVALRVGTPVVAPASGAVADVGEYTLTGRTVVIDHGQGVHSVYFHLDTAVVQKGDAVRAGRTIGRVGDTGLSTGPHLHYATYVHGRDVDPAVWRDIPDFVADSSARPAARAAPR